jgi:SAM-dependent methyltransferase
VVTSDVIAVGRSADEVLSWSRAQIEPALRAVVDELPCAVRHVAGYHLGWWDEHGRPAAGGGKAIRPALVLLAAQAVGCAVPPVSAAVAVELVHNFSLLHDDVMDQDAAKLPFASEMFDAALANGSFEHMPDVSAAFAEVFRTLRPGGRFSFSHAVAKESPTIEEEAVIKRVMPYATTLRASRRVSAHRFRDRRSSGLHTEHPRRLRRVRRTLPAGRPKLPRQDRPRARPAAHQAGRGFHDRSMDLLHRDRTQTMSSSRRCPRSQPRKPGRRGPDRRSR